MMPCPVVVGKRAYDLGKHVRPDGLVERRTESPVGHHAELPRTTATMDAAVVRRRVRRPPEPTGDREVRGGYRNRRSRNPIAGSVEMLCLADLPEDARGADNRPVIHMSREILHPSVRNQSLHVVPQDGTVGRRWRCDGGNLRAGRSEGEKSELQTLSYDI